MFWESVSGVVELSFCVLFHCVRDLRRACIVLLRIMREPALVSSSGDCVELPTESRGLCDDPCVSMVSGGSEEIDEDMVKLGVIRAGNPMEL